MNSREFIDTFYAPGSSPILPRRVGKKERIAIQKQKRQEKEEKARVNAVRIVSALMPKLRSLAQRQNDKAMRIDVCLERFAAVAERGFAELEQTDPNGPMSFPRAIYYALTKKTDVNTTSVFPGKARWVYAANLGMHDGWISDDTRTASLVKYGVALIKAELSGKIVDDGRFSALLALYAATELVPEALEQLKFDELSAVCANADTRSDAIAAMVRANAETFQSMKNEQLPKARTVLRRTSNAISVVLKALQSDSPIERALLVAVAANNLDQKELSALIAGEALEDSLE